MIFATLYSPYTARTHEHIESKRFSHSVSAVFWRRRPANLYNKSFDMCGFHGSVLRMVATRGQLCLRCSARQANKNLGRRNVSESAGGAACTIIDMSWCDL